MACANDRIGPAILPRKTFVMKSIGAKLFAGYLLGIGAALCGFVVVLVLGMKFQAADTNSRAAVKASAQAADTAQMTSAAETALLRFQSTLSGQDRAAMQSLLDKLAAMNPAHESLKGLANDVSELSQKLQVGTSVILDATSAMSLPVLTLTSTVPMTPAAPWRRRRSSEQQLRAPGDRRRSLRLPGRRPLDRDGP